MPIRVTAVLRVNHLVTLVNDRQNLLLVVRVVGFRLIINSDVSRVAFK